MFHPNHLFLVVFLAAFSLTDGAIDVPYGQTLNGHFTYYAGAGKGACGTDIDRETTPLVAISCSYWTTGNPNLDPVCHTNLCVKVTYKGKSITVPVKDQCCSCNPDHLDLSIAAFKQLADQQIGDVQNASWVFVKCSGGNGTSQDQQGKGNNTSSGDNSGSSENPNGNNGNGTSNNGTSNNGTSNNGTSNNGTSNNGTSNNGTSSGISGFFKSIGDKVKGGFSNFQDFFQNIFGKLKSLL